MIDKIRKGNRVALLLYYLYGPGKSDEHRDPHIVAGWREPSDIEPPLRPSGQRDFRELSGLLDAPLDAADRLGEKGTVWHCVLSAAPGDPLLSDARWNEIATEFMAQMGLAPRDDPAGVRWIAVRHGLSAGGIDHVHIVATLARQDGTLPSVHNDFLRARNACRAIEAQFGLTPSAAADRTAAMRPSRAETEQATRNGTGEPPRVRLRQIIQEAAATALSEEDFFARVRAAGALVRYRHSATDPGTVTGYAVAVPGGSARAARPVWFSGGKLAADLTLPALRRRWERPGTPGPGAPDPGASLSPRSARAFLRSAACSAAEQARDEHGYFAALAAMGIQVRHRFSELNPGEITGYALALPGCADDQGEPLWHSGGRLSADLTLPKLRQRWATPGTHSVPRAISPSERKEIWDDVARITSVGAEAMRQLAASDPAAAADAAWATADALRASARVIRGTPGREIRRAAAQFDRAAREAYHVPRQTSTGNALRTASRLLGIIGATGSLPLRADLLIINLARLADATAELRHAQARAHQAAAARTTADRLAAAKPSPDTPRPQPPVRAAGPSKAATEAKAAVPVPPTMRPAQPTEAPRARSSAPPSRSGHPPSQAHPRPRRR